MKQINQFDRVRIVMVNTTEAGNIGAGARAMKNMCLSRLYLVNPKGFPSAAATARASSADDVLAKAVVCGSLAEALQGVNLVIGSSARVRSIKWQQLDVIQSCSLISKALADNTQQQVAVVFGSEKAGLTNEEMDLCHILMRIEGNPEYCSLNIAAAIQVFAYQLFTELSGDTTSKHSVNVASFEQSEYFYERLEQLLIAIDYVDPKKPIDKLMRRLRRLFNRALLEEDEVKILHGIVTAIKKKT